MQRRNKNMNCWSVVEPIKLQHIALRRELSPVCFSERKEERLRIIECALYLTIATETYYREVLGMIGSFNAHGVALVCQATSTSGIFRCGENKESKTAFGGMCERETRYNFHFHYDISHSHIKISYKYPECRYKFKASKTNVADE